MKGTEAFVIDTSVPVVANRRHPKASKQDILACIDALENSRRGVLVIDDANRVLREYRRHLSPKGQPGVGDAFMKWLWDNRANPRRCELVKLTPRNNGTDDFEEFPDDSRLSKFDRSDRKFAAAARASKHSPPVLNASDSDWWDYEKPLRDNGIHVKHICPDIARRWVMEQGRP